VLACASRAGGANLGSVRQMTDVHGTVTYAAAYIPYGETLGSQ